MIGARVYAYAALAGGALALGTYVWVLRADNALLEAEIALKDRSIAALTMRSEQSALARRVEAARADRFAKRASKLSATVEALLTGDIPDEDLDPRIADFVNGLRQTVR